MPQGFDELLQSSRDLKCMYGKYYAWWSTLTRNYMHAQQAGKFRNPITSTRGYFSSWYIHVSGTLLFLSSSKPLRLMMWKSDAWICPAVSVSLFPFFFPGASPEPSSAAGMWHSCGALCCSRASHWQVGCSLLITSIQTHVHIWGVTHDSALIFPFFFFFAKTKHEALGAHEICIVVLCWASVKMKLSREIRPHWTLRLLKSVPRSVVERIKWAILLHCLKYFFPIRRSQLFL